jgi:hypothetical protein
MNKNGKNVQSRRGSGPQQQKLFTAVKRGWNFSAIPNGAEGWRAMFLATAPLLLLTALFAWIVSQPKYKDSEAALTIGFISITIFWSIWFLRWVYQNSDIIDVNGKRKG